MKSLKKLYIQDYRIFFSSDIPFLVQCARETTADIFIQLGVQPYYAQDRKNDKRMINIHHYYKFRPVIEMILY